MESCRNEEEKCQRDKPTTFSVSVLIHPQSGLLLDPRGRCLHKQSCRRGCVIHRPDREADLQLSWWIKRDDCDSFQLVRKHLARHNGDAKSFTDHSENGSTLAG